MNTIFLEILNKKFANQFTHKEDENGSFINFPAKTRDFGDVNIYEEYPGAYILEVGNFTHSHFYEGTEDEMAIEAAKDIIDFLDNLFSDSIVCYGSHECGGGWYLRQDDENENINWTDLFVWSGLFRKAERDE